MGKLWLEVSPAPGLVVLEKYLAGAVWKRGQIWGRWVMGAVKELLWPTKPERFVGSALGNGWVNTTQACNGKIDVSLNGY